LNNDDKKLEWEKSYLQKDNFVFYPHEEVIRFVTKYIRKRIGISEFENSKYIIEGPILDLGCGIGRHVSYLFEMGLDVYGVDISDVAITIAREWLLKKGCSKNHLHKIIQGNIVKLPWNESKFSYAVSHGVLDSMSFKDAKLAIKELARCMIKGGYFYCDLISGDDSLHSKEYSGEELVTSAFENGTIQTYFNQEKIKELIQDVFNIAEVKLIRVENLALNKYHSRYHLILRRL
jgi:ubiquinone/menaquinone biosynthesis C-methylase UbiE